MTAPEWTGYFALVLLAYFALQSVQHDPQDPQGALVIVAPLLFLAGVFVRFAYLHRHAGHPADLTVSNRQHAQVYTWAAGAALLFAGYLLITTWSPYIVEFQVRRRTLRPTR